MSRYCISRYGEQLSYSSRVQRFKAFTCNMFSTLETSGISCRFNGARNILDRVDEAAKKALDKATMIHTNAIESLYDAERTIVPDIDTSLQLAEAQNILEQVRLASRILRVNRVLHVSNYWKKCFFFLLCFSTVNLIVK